MDALQTVMTERVDDLPLRLAQLQQTYAQLSELTPLQRRILQALTFPVSIYTRLGPESQEPL